MKKTINILKHTFSIFWKILAGISTVFSLCISFLPWDDYDTNTLLFVGIYFAIGIFALFLLCFLIYFLYQKHLDHITLKIDGSELTILSGDIFSFDSKVLKVIGFNSHFDTHVGDGVIDANSLNGIYLNKFYKDDRAIQNLKNRIDKCTHLNQNLILASSSNNDKKKYKLGSIYKDKDFLLLALTNFDERNNARVTLNELADCFLRMWSKIDELKGSLSIAMPLLGSGSTTRIGKKGSELKVSNQELLELLLATFKISRIKIKKPANITIVLQKRLLHSTDEDERIDLLKIKEMY